MWYANYLAATERFADAFAEISLAQKLDPLSAMIGANAGRVFLSARQYDRALEQIRKALEQGVIHQADIYGEIGEIAAGLKAGRENAEEITYFKSVGNAAQDVAVAREVYQQALKQNLGIEVEL